jgi:hypothetical protein
VPEGRSGLCVSHLKRKQKQWPGVGAGGGDCGGGRKPENEANEETKELSNLTNNAKMRRYASAAEPAQHVWVCEGCWSGATTTTMTTKNEANDGTKDDETCRIFA